MFSPRYLKLGTISTTAPSMFCGRRGLWLFLESTTMSLVLVTLMQRLLSPHHVSPPLCNRTRHRWLCTQPQQCHPQTSLQFTILKWRREVHEEQADVGCTRATILRVHWVLPSTPRATSVPVETVKESVKKKVGMYCM